MENLEPSKTPTKNKIKLDFKDSKYATGRRKRSIAKVWIKRGSGNIYVNGLYEQLFLNKWFSICKNVQ